MNDILAKLSLTETDAMMIPVCAVLFFLLWKTLEKGFFARSMALLEAREKATSGAEANAAEDRAAADEATTNYEAKIVNGRVEAMKKKAEVINKAKAEAAVILQKAQDEAQSFIKSVRSDLDKKVGDLRNQAMKDSDRMADQLVEKLSAPQRTPSQLQ